MTTGCLCEMLAGPGTEVHPKCFGQVWLFEGTPQEAWHAVSGLLVRKQLDSGEAVFRQGEKADSMFLIKAGLVKLWKATEDGRELILDIRKAGDLLGENVLIEAGDYPVFATTLSTALLCGIDRPTFEKLVQAYPQVGLAVIRNLSKRIGFLTGRIGALSESSIEERLYRVLLTVAKQIGSASEGGWTMAFPLTHEEIGFLVGAHRVSITRALKKLRQSGMVRGTGKRFLVTDDKAPA